MSDLKNNLIRLQSYLTDWKRPVIQYLLDGLSYDTVTSKLSSIGFTPTMEISDLYEWHNGTKIVEGAVLDDMHLFPGFYLLSLDDAITQYLALVNDQRWNADWFPIFSNGGGDFYALDYSQLNKGFTPIIGFLIGESEHPVEYQSLTTMVATLLECFEQKVFVVTDDGYLDMDDAHYKLVAKKHNPNVAIWQA